MNDNFWNSSTFLPGRDSSKLDLLLETVHKKREVEFIAFCLQLSSVEPRIYSETGFDLFFDQIRNADREMRQNLVSDPHYFAWFRQTTRAQADRETLRQKLRKFEHVLEQVKNPDRNGASLEINGQLVVLERFRLDPVIADLALPEYQVPEKKRQELFDCEVNYPESYFKAAMVLALARIQQAWPEAHKYFPHFVKIVVDMIDGEYTSYSSADLTGTIFVSTDNSPLVALEEYLIHEFGHQVLYLLMEVDPLVSGENNSVYELPWSGNERDLYGYFHAFFIYVFMASYLENVRHRSAREQRRINLRRKHVVSGLEKAITDLGKARGFTERGSQLYSNLVLEIEQLKKHSV